MSEQLRGMVPENAKSFLQGLLARIGIDIPGYVAEVILLTVALALGIWAFKKGFKIIRGLAVAFIIVAVILFFL